MTRSSGAHRPIILTSIDEIVQRPDVIDRSIFLQLRSIAASSRRREQDLWAEFMTDYPRILGGLLDAVVAGMRLWSEVRLADSSAWPTLPTGARRWHKGSAGHGDICDGL